MFTSWSALWVAVERFAHARGALPAVFLWNLGQGSVVPGPAELLLVPLAIADPPRAPRLAVAAIVGSTLGGCLAYGLGAAAFATVGTSMLQLLGVTDDALANTIALMRRHGWLFVFASTLMPISAKAVSVGAGAVAMPFPEFALALGVGRTLRFGADVLLLRAGAGLLQRWRQRLLSR